MESWRTGITSARDGEIRLRGYDVRALMTGATFTDVVFLLHRGELPTTAQRRLLDAILCAVADHGSGAPSCAAARLAISGNRSSVSAGVAAGILAVGDEHGGAGSGCIDMIAAGLARASRDQLSFDESAERTVAEWRAAGRRVPGLGHRVHSRDPRTPILFALARDLGLAGDGVLFMEALERVVARSIKPLPINIDGALAAVLYDMGFPAVFARLLFLIGRTAGLTAEVREELERERPMRIRIPVDYDGEPPRALD